VREDSTSELLMPRSPADIMYSGTFMFSATDSAVRVFPIPGPPDKSMMIPLPLPEITSSKESLYFTWDSAKARMSSF